METVRISVPVLDPIRQPPYETGMTNEQRFALFDEHNPHVFEALAHMALRAWRGGRRRISIKAYYEVLRQAPALTTTDETSPWKLDNTYTAFYAKKLVETYPQLDGIIERRKRRSRQEEN